MRTVAIIQARMNSTRFPGKVLADLCGKPVLKHVIDRVRMCRRVDEVAVALSREDDWQPIDGRCEEWGVECHAFNVPAEDVLRRYVRACSYWNVEMCVRVCGDNPLIMPEDIDLLVRDAEPSLRAVTSYMFSLNRPMLESPTGYFAELIHRDTLARYDALLDAGDPRREHVTRPLYEADEWNTLPPPSWYLALNPPNAAIDTPEDLERVAEMLNTKGK